MLSLIRKTVASLRSDGVTETFYRAVRYPFKEDIESAAKRILAMDTPEKRFTEIYRTGMWSNGRTTSGVGSTMAYTENLRAKLPQLFSTFDIKTVFDAPCGDFNWMQVVVRDTGITYIGGDIVKPLTEDLSRKHKTDRASFIHIDLTRDEFPAADLMICRDCLFHLSFADTKLVLENFVTSKIPYLLTTTHKGSFLNRDIVTGHYRLIDLFAAPYNFPRDTLARIDDWKAPAPPREMCLWSREQIAQAIQV